MQEKKQIQQMSEEEILGKLMGEYTAPRKTYFIDRLQIPIEMKGLTEKEISKLRVQCTYDNKLDSNEFDAALIYASTTNFNWNNEKLLNAHQASSGKELIRKILLAGEITSLTRIVLELSGFTSSVNEVEVIKN